MFILVKKSITQAWADSYPVRISGSTHDRYDYDHRNRLVSVEEVNLQYAPGEGKYTTWEMGGPLYPENPDSLYAVAVQPAVEGDALVLMVGWLLEGAGTVDYYIEEVPGSAVEGVHYTNPQDSSESNWIYLPWSEYENGHRLYIPTHYDSASTGSLTLLVHVRLDGEFEFVAQGVKIFDESGARIHDRYYKVHDGSTVNGISHDCYSQAVRKELKSFLGRRGVSSMTTTEAREFLNSIKNSQNPVIHRFNEGAIAEAAIAKEVGEKAYKAARNKRLSHEVATKVAVGRASVAALSFRGRLNKIAATKAAWWGLKAFSWFCKAAPVGGAVAKYFSTGNLQAAGREAVIDLMGLDIARDGGELAAALYDEAVRERDELAQEVKENLGFNPLNP